MEDSYKEIGKEGKGNTGWHSYWRFTTTIIWKISDLCKETNTEKVSKIYDRNTSDTSKRFWKKNQEIFLRIDKKIVKSSYQRNQSQWRCRSKRKLYFRYLETVRTRERWQKEASYYPNETDSMKAISRNQVSFKKCINVLSKKTKRKIF